MSYGSGQRWAFAGLVIGFLLCASGAIAPYWLEGSITINEFTKVFGERLPFIGDTKLVTHNGGLWWHCYSLLDHKECKAYDFGEIKSGGAGIAAVGIFASTAEDGFLMKLNLVQYGWAFYIYIAGSALVVLVSFLLCFASPNNSFAPVIISSVNQIMPNNRYTLMSDEHILIEQPYRNDPCPVVSY
ncbi:hypothetical protein BsWGS_16663 [Bradybaena similaris]